MATNRYLALTMAGLLVTVSLAACHNTMRGAGEDVERMGETMQENSHN